MPARRTSASDRGDQRRTAVLDALVALMQTTPYDEIGVSDIARQAGITRSAFYFYFPTKDAAIAAALDQYVAQIINSDLGLFAQGSTESRDALRVSLELSIDLWRSNPRFWAGCLEAAARDPTVDDVVEQTIVTMADAVTAIIENGSSPRTGPPVSLLVRALLDMNRRIAQRDVHTILTTGEPIPQLADTLTAIWTRTLYPGT